MDYKDIIEKTGKTKSNYIRKNILTISMITFAAICLASIPVGISVKFAGNVKAEAEAMSARYEETSSSEIEEEILIEGEEN